MGTGESIREQVYVYSNLGSVLLIIMTPLHVSREYIRNDGSGDDVLTVVYGRNTGKHRDGPATPMTLPLRHFVLGLVFLLGGTLVGIGIDVDAIPGLGTLAHVHLLLAGWICITIMGAVTQYVPIWSGAPLHSRKRASAQLTLVVVGLVGFVTGLVLNSLAWLVPFGDSCSRDSGHPFIIPGGRYSLSIRTT